MEEILKEILSKIENLGERIDAHDKSNKEIVSKIEILGERIEAHDKSNKDEFRKIDKKLDGVTEVVAKTMEDVTELNSKVEKQEIEFKVFMGAK